MQVQTTHQELRNFTLYCGEIRHRRLPLVGVRWLDERRPTCEKAARRTKATNLGRKFPATPIYGNDAEAILDAMFTPGVHSQGKWCTKWGPLRLRNRTVMACAKGTGMRIHELLLLRADDIDFETNQVVVRRGKGGKRRVIAILPEALAEVRVWMHVWDALGFSVLNDDLLFPVIEGDTKGKGLSQAYMRVKLHEAAREAGVSRRAACHQWRHGFAVDAHHRKIELGYLQRQLGHSSPQTTGVYLQGISPSDVVDAVLGAFA